MRARKLKPEPQKKYKVRARPANKLEFRRRSLEISREQIARMIDVAYATYARFETTQIASSLGLQKKKLLSKITELPVEEMFKPVDFDIDTLLKI